MRKIFLTLFLIFSSPQKLFATTHHADDHKQIFHAFLLETDVGRDRNGDARGWDLDGWVGKDFDRLWLKSEKKTYGKYEQKSEFQALYGRNISQFWDAQIGLRHDFTTDFSSQKVDYLTLGFEGLAPYFFESDAHIFLSEKGNFSARLKQKYDIFLTQKLIMQPYLEADFFAQNVPELNVSSGLSELEIGITTRYEFKQKFAPYFALRYNTKTSNTKKLSQKEGDQISDFITSIGVMLRF